MFLIKGYDIYNRNTAKKIEIIRFSSFSNILAETDVDIKDYRNTIETKLKEEKGIDVSISFIMHDIPSKSNDAQVLSDYLRGKSITFIAKNLRISEDTVDRLLKIYIYGR